MKLYHNAPNLAVNSELGRFSIRTFRLVRVIKYWLRLLSLPQHRIVYTCYKFQFGEAEKSRSCWAHGVKQLLFSLGMGEAWLNQGVGNVTVFVNLFKQRCQDIYIQEWQTSMSAFPKLDLYREFKSIFGREKYFSVLTEEKFRNALCRFRVSAHSLRIESDRYLHNTRAERICLYCNTNNVENEFHFCLICPFYTNFRVKYIPKYFYTPPSTDKFVKLLQSENVSIIRNLSKFILYSTKKRSNAFVDTASVTIAINY